MRQLVNKIFRYFKLYRYLVKFSFLDILAYRFNSLLMGVAPIIWLGTMLLFIKIIYGGIKELGGWGVWDLVFLTAVQEVIFIFSWVTFTYNLDRFTNEVKTGSLDFTLIKPINHRFLVSFRFLDFTQAFSVVNTLVVFVISWSHLHLTPEFWRLIGFIFLLIIGYWLVYCVHFILASLNLFFISAKDLGGIVGEMMDFGRYPIDIYQTWFKRFLLYFVPILFYAYIPTAFLLGKISGIYLLYAPFVLAVFYLISQFVWRAGLRRYQSASS